MASIASPPAGDISMQIGDTFQGPHRDPSYWSLRYDFKPASVNSDAPGTLRVGADNQVSLDLLNKSEGNGDLGFSGHSEKYDGLDCVAIFDGKSWRLELLTGSLKVRHVKGQARASPAPQALPAVVHEVVGEQLPTSSMDAVNTQAEGQDWRGRDLSQEASESHPANQHMSDAAATSDQGTDSGDEEDGQVQQSTDVAMTDVPATQHPRHADGLLDQTPAAHQSSDENDQDTEDDGDDNDDGDVDGNEEADMPQQVPVANGQMTDLERQYFGHTQAPSSESSDSSSDSDQESLNAASEDDDDDGLDHF